MGRNMKPSVDVEAQIEAIAAFFNAHHFGASPGDKPFCSCGWIGEPSDNWLSAERQFDRHQATAMVMRGGRFGGNWDDGVRRAEPVIPGATVERYLAKPKRIDWSDVVAIPATPDEKPKRKRIDWSDVVVDEGDEAP